MPLLFVNLASGAAQSSTSIAMHATRTSANDRSAFPAPLILTDNAFHRDIEEFNSDDNELYPNSIDNAHAWEFLRPNVPLFDCPDRAMCEIYNFRWWTFRKHLRKTPAGWIVTEFLPDVPWAGVYNSIDCAAGHHIMEGRWLADPVYMNDYSGFWFAPGGGEPRRYSFWAASAVYQRALVSGDTHQAISLLPSLIKNYAAWELSNSENGLYQQIDDRDGMEMSIGGSGFRPTINSYMYGDAVAISKIAGWAGNTDVANEYKLKAESLKELVLEKLWDPGAVFFKVLPTGENAQLVGVREELGFTPWYFELPPDSSKYSAAWGQLMDPQGFYAPYGPTTAERRDPKFVLNYQGHECQWNGPSWPFATSITITAMANLLEDYHQDVVTRADYFTVLQNYAKSQHIKHDDGTVTPWIDEDLNPDTGDWMARTIQKDGGHWSPIERGKDYNHSTFCDLVITGLVGLRPRADNTLEVNPLVPTGKWDYFCLDGVHYHGHVLSILWDKTGKHYGHGQGLRVFVDGNVLSSRKDLGLIEAKLPV